MKEMLQDKLSNRGPPDGCREIIYSLFITCQEPVGIATKNFYHTLFLNSNPIHRSFFLSFSSVYEHHMKSAMDFGKRAKLFLTMRFLENKHFFRQYRYGYVGLVKVDHHKEPQRETIVSRPMFFSRNFFDGESK